MPTPKRTSKRQLIDELVTAFRTSGNQDGAFDNLAAERLGINRTDLLCLNAIENSGGLTAERNQARPPRRQDPPPPRPAPRTRHGRDRPPRARRLRPPRR